MGADVTIEEWNELASYLNSRDIILELLGGNE